MPFLFAGIEFPEQCGLVDSFAVPGGYCTGVVHPKKDVETYCRYFYECFPQAKKILLLSPLLPMSKLKGLLPAHATPLETLADTHMQIQSFFADKDIEVDIVSDLAVELLFAQVEKKIRTVDAVFLLEGSRLLQWGQDLAMQCLDLNIILYTGSVNDVPENGGMLGYGADYMVIADALAQQALEILVRGKKVSEVRVIALENTRFAAANKTLLERSGVDSTRIAPTLEKWDAKVE